MMLKAFSLAIVLALLTLLASSTAHADTLVCTIAAPSSFSGSTQFGTCNVDVNNGDTYYATISADSISQSFSLQVTASVGGTTVFGDTITVSSCSSSCSGRIPSSGCSNQSPASGTAGVTVTGTSSSTVTISNGQAQVYRCDGGSDDGVGCFANGQSVTLSSGASVPIEEVREGDRVLAADPSDHSKLLFSPVTWIMQHQTPKQTLRLTLKSHDALEEEAVTVVVTPNHLMVVPGKGTIDAADVKVGDAMWGIFREGEEARLATVTAVHALRQAQQVRLVLTESGTIVVNGVVASSLESSGSSVVKQLLDLGQAVGGETGASAARAFTYAVGSLVTRGDAQQQASPTVA